MTYRANTADQELDIRGSDNQSASMVLSEEPLKLGQRINSGAAASITVGANVQLSGIAGLLRGNYVTISGAADAGNNRTFLISEIIAANIVVIINSLASTDPNNGSIAWQHRKAYSIEDDLNYERTDREAIKGVDYYDPVPVYNKCVSVSTDTPANLSNIAGKTTDAKAIITNVKVEGVNIPDGSTYYLVLGSCPWADAVNRTGIPLYDGADAGNKEATCVDLGNLRVLSGIYEGWKIYGRARAGLSGVDGFSFEVEFRAYEGVNDVPYTWEANQQNILTIYYPYRYCLDQVPETSLRDKKELPVPNSVGQVLMAVETDSFMVAQPVTNKNGWLVNNDGILLVNTH
jgi:hypothetical protein